MSYEIVKNIRIDKKHKKIFINSACSNVMPKYYYTKEFEPSNIDFEKKQYDLFYYVLTGEYHIDKCKNENYRNAFENFRDYLYSKKLCQQDLWDYEKDSKDLKEYYNIFKSFLFNIDKNISLSSKDGGLSL